MIVTVEFREIIETAENTETVGNRNRILNDTAFQFQNFKLDSLKLVEPKDLAITLTLYYDNDDLIKWAFNKPSEIPEHAKTAIRDLLR